MISLFIDTSLVNVSISIIKDDKILSLIQEEIPNMHSVYVTKYIKDALDKNNIARSFIDSGDAKIIENGIYYNPASPKVLDLLLREIQEIISNYNVDGIHFDDYFYPDNTIDIEQYSKYFIDNNIFGFFGSIYYPISLINKK